MKEIALIEKKTCSYSSSMGADVENQACTVFDLQECTKCSIGCVNGGLLFVAMNFAFNRVVTHKASIIAWLTKVCSKFNFALIIRSSLALTFELIMKVGVIQENLAIKYLTFFW